MGASTIKLPDTIHERVIHRVLKQKVEQYGNRDFFYFNDRSYGYEDLDHESDKVAAGLQAIDIGKGDKVAIEMNNRPEFLFLWFGLSKLGAVEVPINTAHRGNLLTYMIDKADCRLVVTESRFFDRLGPILRNLPKVEKIVVLSDGNDEIPALDKPTLDERRVGAVREPPVQALRPIFPLRSGAGRA